MTRTFQRIYSKSRTLVNTTKPGRDIRHFLRSEAAMSTIEQYGCGWLDGGCWTLARALSLWTHPEGRIRHMYDTHTERSEHAVCHMPSHGLYLDGDGIATEAELLVKMYVLEDFDRRLSIRDATPKDNDPNNIWEATARQMATLLLKTFGTWPESDIRRHLQLLRPPTHRNETHMPNRSENAAP